MPLMTPAEYVAMQIARSRAKFHGFCKVDPGDPPRYAAALGPVARILCLGVRDGTELDLFKLAFPLADVQGVEINPDAGVRPDIWVGSFDALPDAWTARYDLVFSNALDHAAALAATLREWQRVLVPGGTAILALNGPAVPMGADCCPFTLEMIRPILAACDYLGEQTGHYREAWFRKRV